MFASNVQTILLFAVAFILGCMIGCVLKSLIAGKSRLGQSPEETTNLVGKAKFPDPSRAEQKSSKPEPADSKIAKKPAAVSKSDNLKLIKGIGAQNERQLNALGVSTFAQIAAWSVAEQKDMGEALAFPGRIEREDWVDQAAKLRDRAATEFSKLESESVTTSVGEAAGEEGAERPTNLLEAPRQGGKDPLTSIKGVGAVIETKLNRLGIFHFDQIASLSSEQLRWLDTELGFPGRAEREDWKGEAASILRDGVPLADQSMVGSKVKIIPKA